jgi:hypothetical protein
MPRPSGTVLRALSRSVFTVITVGRRQPRQFLLPLNDAVQGVIKTHRLLLNEPESLVAPSVPESDEVSHITLPARTIKDMLDHFPASRGSGDPQLVWTFDAMEVLVRSFEMGAESRGLWIRAAHILFGLTSGSREGPAEH